MSTSSVAPISKSVIVCGDMVSMCCPTDGAMMAGKSAIPLPEDSVPHQRQTHASANN